MSNAKDLINLSQQAGSKSTSQPFDVQSEDTSGTETRLRDYDFTSFKGFDLNDIRAERQSDAKALLNAGFQTLSTIVGDAISGVGYLGELGDINDIVSGQETEWGNWLTKAGESIKKAGEEFAPVYASQEALTTFAPWDFEWWASNIPSIGSTLALIAPSYGVVGLTSRLGKAAGIAQKLSAETGKALSGIGMAITSRHIENMMESKEVFDNSYNLAIEKGMTEDRAKEIAAKAASNAYNTNYINLITDIPQYLTLLGVKLPKGIKLGKGRVGQAAEGFVSEAAEEATQFVIQKESERVAEKELGVESDTTFGQRLSKYLQDPGLQTAAFFGGLGGGVFGALGKTVDRAEMPVEQAREEATQDILNDAIEEEDFNTPKETIQMIKTDPEIAKNETAIQNLSDAEELINHAEKTYNSLVGDKYQKEKTKLSTQARQIEQKLQHNEQSVQEIKSKIKDQDQFDYKFLSLQLEKLKGKRDKYSTEVRDQIKSEMNSERFEEMKNTKLDAFTPHISNMNSLAEQRVNEKIKQEKVNEEFNKYSTPEGIEQVEKQEKQQKKKQEQEVINEAKEVTTPQQIEQIKQDNPELVDQLNEVSQEKIKEEKKDVPNINDYNLPEQIDEFISDRYDSRPFLLESDLTKYGFNSIEELKQATLNKYSKPPEKPVESVDSDLDPFTSSPALTQEQLENPDLVAEGTLADQLQVEAATKTETKPEATEIEPYEVSLSNQDSVEFVIEESENPAIGQTNDVVLYRTIEYEGKIYVQYSGLGKQGQKYNVESQKEKFKHLKESPEWTTLYSNEGKLLKSEWRQIEFDYDQLRKAYELDPIGSTVYFEVDTTSEEAFDYDGWKSLRILARIEHDGKKHTLAMLKSFREETKDHPLSEDFKALRQTVYNEWKKANKPQVFRSSLTGTIDDVYGGRYFNTPVRNNPKDVLATGEPLVFAVGTTAGEINQYHTNEIGINVISSLKQPSSGAVYQAIKTSNGRYAWNRLFTKKLSNDTARAKQGDFPVWEELFGYSDVSLKQVVLDLLSVAETSPDVWKDKWSDIRKEVQSIVRFTKTDKKGNKQYAPDFGANLPKIFASKGYTAQSFYDFLELDSKTIQIDNKKINTEDYNERVSDRLETDINPYVHTHSPKFVFTFPSVPQVNKEIIPDEDVDIMYKIADSTRTGTWNKEKEVKWFKERFPYIPIKVLERIIALGGRDAWGALTSAAGVLISSKAQTGTVYHEAFHVAFNLALTEKEQELIMSEAKKKYGDLNEDTLEEYLADAFMEYVQTLETSLGARIKRFFRELLEFLGFSYNNRLSINYLFDQIERGKYSDVRLGKRFYNRYKLVTPFSNLQEQRLRVKESLHYFDLIVDQLRRKEGLSLEEAYSKVIKNPEYFNGTSVDGITSILQKYKNQKQSVKLTKKTEQEFDRVIAALQTNQFIDQILNKLGTRGIYVTSGVTDNKVFEEEQDFLESWQTKSMQISPLENLTGRLKRFLDNVPKFDGRGKPVVSTLGIKQYHEGRFLYADLQSRLGGSISVEDMLEKLSMTKTPTYDWLYKIVSESKELQSDLFRMAQKVHPVFFDVVNTDGKYSIKISNTDSLSNTILSDWYTTFSNSRYNKYLNTDNKVVYVDRLSKAWTKVYNQIQSGKKPTSEFQSILNDLGLNVPVDVLETADFSKVGPKFNTWLTSFIAGDVGFNNSPVKELAKTFSEYYPIQYQDAHINVEGNREYEWINSSYVGRFMSAVTRGKFDWGKFKQDKYFNKLIELGVINPTSWSKAQWSVVGGIKHTRRRGIPFTSFSDKDTAITMLTMFKEGWYNLSVNSSSSAILSAIKLGKEQTRTEAFNKLKNLAIAEHFRMNQESPSGWKNYTPNKYAFFPYLKDGQEADFTAIKDDLTKQFTELKSNLTRLNLIKEGKLIFDTSLNVEEFLLDFIYNFNLKQAEIILVMQGDPNFYKTDRDTGSKIDDFFKRAREVWSPGNYLDTSAEYKTSTGKIIKFPANGKYKIKIKKDLEITSPQIEDIKSSLNRTDNQSVADSVANKYNKVNVTDAQSYIDLYSYRLRLIGEKRWTDTMQEAYDLLVTGKNSKEIFQPIKPFYYTQQIINELLAPMQNKDSEFLLLPAFAQGNPELEAILFEFGYSKDETGWSFDEEGRDAGKYIDKVSFESTIKVQMTSPYVAENLSDAVPIEMNWSDWRRQMETPEHHVDTTSRFATQIMQLITADLADDAVFSDNLKGRDIKQQYETLVIQDIVRSSEELRARFTTNEKINKEEFVKLLREEVNKRQLGDQYLDALSMTYSEVLGEMDTTLPLFHPLHSTRIEAMVSSLFKNNITKQQFQTGVSLFNVSSYGLTRQPKIVFKSDGGIDYIECYAPAYSSYFDKYRDDAGNIDIERIQTEEPEILEGIVYRIPTEDKYSMFNIKIIGFTSDSSGGAIILPPEITTIAGLDFDIDKTYGFFHSKGNPYAKALAKLDNLISKDFEKNVLNSSDPAVDSLWKGIMGDLYDDVSAPDKQYVEDVLNEHGKSLAAYEAIEAKVKQHDVKQKSDNEKLRLMKLILSHPSMTRAFLDPGGFDTIRGVTKQIKKFKGEQTKVEAPNNPIAIINAIRRINAGAALTGIAANYNVSKARWQNYNLSLKDSFLFDGLPYDNLSQIEEASPRTKDTRNISRNIAEVLASAVDNGKEPLAEFYNMNTYTADVGLSMLATGIPLNTMMFFLSQPSIVKYVNDYFNNDQKEVETKLEPLSSPSNIDFNELISNLKNPKPEDQDRFLQNFIYYKEMVKPVTDLVITTKIPMSGAGPSIADTVVKSRTYHRLVQGINGVEEFINDTASFHNTFTVLGIDQAAEVFTELGFPNFTFKSGLKQVIDKISGFKGTELTSRELNTVYKNYMEYLSSKSTFFNSDQARELHENLHEKVTKAQEIKKDNMFLNRLEIKDKVINFRAVVSIHKEEFDDYRQSWAEMLEDQTVIEDNYRMSNLATDLIKYSFLRSGFNPSGFGNFSHLQPIEFYTQHPEGREFNNLLIQQVQSQNNAANDPAYTMFVDQFIRNNFKFLYYIDEISDDNIILNDKNEPVSTTISGESGPKYLKYKDTLFKKIDDVYTPIPTLGFYQGNTQIMKEYQFGVEELSSSFTSEQEYIQNNDQPKQAEIKSLEEDQTDISDDSFKTGEIVKVVFTIDNKTVVVDAEVLQNLKMEEGYNIDLKNTKTGKIYSFNMDSSGNVFTQIVGNKVITDPDITVRRETSEVESLWLNYSDKILTKKPDYTFDQLKRSVDKYGIDYIRDYLAKCYK